MRFRNRQTASRLLTMLLAGTMLVACTDKPDPDVVQQDIPFTPEGILDVFRADSSLVTRFIIELAETDQEQAQGLMYRRSLPQRGGMLFIDDFPKMQEFWMRNTPLSLDILFLDDNGQIINIVKRTTPYSDDLIRSTAPAAFVFEVRSGTTDRLGIDSTFFTSWERRTFE